MKRKTSPPTPSPCTERGPEGEVDLDDLTRQTSGIEGPGGEVKGWRTDPQLWARLKPIARQMRAEATEAENLLWQRLRGHRLLGFKFRRQHSLERFIVDFYCAVARLAVEVDGPVHQYQPQEDRIRQEFLESQGLRVLRFSNHEVLQDLEPVLSQITQVLTSLSQRSEIPFGPHFDFPLSASGEGARG